MAKTIQKRVKFSKGQISDELIERVDTDILDSSAQLMKNVVSTVYGGVRSRRGTKYIDIITSLQERSPDSISSDIYTDTTNFEDNTTKESEQIGTGRIMALLDYGESSSPLALLRIKKIRTKPKIYEYITAQSGTVTLKPAQYIVTVVGGGSGSSADSDETASRGRGAGGGSGAFCQCKLTVSEETTYSFTVGGGGAAGNHDKGYSQQPSGVGGTSTFGIEGTDYISCTGGTAAYAIWTRGGTSYVGNGGTYTYNDSQLELISASNGNDGSIRAGNNGTAAGGESLYEGYGAGASSYVGGNYNSTTNAGVGGCVIIEAVLEEGDELTDSLVISKSQNGVNYETVAEETITQTTRDIEVILEMDRYIKIEISGVDASFNLNHAIEFQYMVENISPSSINESKLVPFIYNNSDKYLLILVSGQIQVFKNDTLIQTVTATGLDSNYLKDIKYASKDDTIVFTHRDMHPKILKRTGVDTFTWGDLDIQNIPYTLFGEETTTEKTVGITPSELEGALKITADSAIFDASWVGQYIDGNGGRVKITEYTSTTVVKGYTVIPFYTKDKITSWNYISGYEEVWSDARGYPVSCLFAQQRLWFGGSKSKPATMWASRLGDYFNFKNSGNYDNDSIDVDLLTNDPILSMTEQRGIHVFTSGQEYTATEGTYTPDKFTIIKNTSNGSIGLQPALISGAVCFIEKNGKSLLSYVYDDTQSAFVSDNLSLFSNLIQKPVDMDVEINSSKDKGDFLYVVLEDGTMLVACVVLSQKIMSISQYITLGNIVGVCCLKEDVYISVVRNGNLFIEKLVDGSKTDSIETRYIATKKIDGLYRFNNKSIYVYSDKEVYGKYNVEENSVTLEKIPNENCNIGIAFDYELVGNPITINSMSTSIKKRITTADLVCKDTYRLSFCGQEKHGKDEYKFYACTPYGNSVKYNISGEFYPINILSVQLNINYEG